MKLSWYMVLAAGYIWSIEFSYRNNVENIFFDYLLVKVGIAAIQIAKALGLRVIGTASTEQGLQAIRDQGADLAFNHKHEGYLKEISVCIFSG